MVVLELLSAIEYLDAGFLADEFVVGAFVDVLETAPAADVVDQDDIEIGLALLHVGHQFLQVLAAVDPQPAATLVDIGLDDLDLSLGGVIGDRCGLVLNRVLLLERGRTYCAA